MTEAWPKTRECVVCERPFTIERRAGALPVTCSPECRRLRHNENVYRWRDTAVCPPHKHGTIEGYATWSCGCDDCREASKLYRAMLRALDAADWEKAEELKVALKELGVQTLNKIRSEKP